MRISRAFAISLVLPLGLLTAGGSALHAQTGTPWVDPPANPTAPAQASPAPVQPPMEAPKAAPPVAAPAPPAQAPAVNPPVHSAQPSKPDPAPEAAPTRQSAQPPRRAPPAVASQPGDPAEEEREARIRAARDFTLRYLETWSAQNDAALDATAEFYAPQVLYHGRTISLKKLHGEKRRFARRWPEREYRPRPDTMGIACNETGNICTVHTVFDYVASNPKRGRSSQGSGALQMIVHFIGDKPVIVAEHSTLLSQERKRTLALEGRSND